MAGSFSHCDANDGSFNWGLIDNMGDAFEACHMMHWMIRNLANAEGIKAAEAAYYAHLREHGYEPYKVRR